MKFEERTVEDDIQERFPRVPLCECQECGEPCKPEDDLCSLCYLIMADVEGEA